MKETVENITDVETIDLNDKYLVRDMVTDFITNQAGVVSNGLYNSPGRVDASAHFIVLDDGTLVAPRPGVKTRTDTQTVVIVVDENGNIIERRVANVPNTNLFTTEADEAPKKQLPSSVGKWLTVKSEDFPFNW